MKGTIVFGLLFLAVLTGCQPKVVYAMYGRMKLAEKEINAYPVGSADIQSFDHCCYTESDVIFLNRAIHNSDKGYDIFIAVSESVHQSEFSAIQSADKSITVLESKTSLVSKIKVDGYLLKKNDKIVARFVYHEVKSGLLVIFDLSSANETFIRSQFTNMQTYLDEKIRL